MTGLTDLSERSVRQRTPAPAGATPSARRRPRRAVRESAGLVFITPGMLMLGLFMLVPTIYALWSSLYSTRIIGGHQFVGAANYVTILHSADFWSGVVRVLVFGVVQVPVTLALAFLFAALFDAGVIRASKFFRTVFFMPFAVPGVVAAVMWSFLLLPGFGPYAQILRGLGLGNVDFFSSGLILPTIMLIVVWEWTGYNMTIIYTSLKSIPREVTEAAIMEGASLWRIITRIKLPMVMPSVVMLVFLNAVGALQLFTEPSILAAFQPQAVSFGFTPSLYVYNTAVGSGQYELGAAAAIVLAVIIGAISVAGFAFRRQNGEFR
ncbi:carbohydrate ABC transporter permease [Curtobacterium sp. MCBD17_028]|uniref:carbohydrate ABC transporter permease n=1 Tax=Curtobacterium sp. MCBD17_028 TaxID=2175670 RepID=UPI001C64DD94|nr:sugar ABC transporter permease [Curtobacterium sp. MCBD17_028]